MIGVITAKEANKMSLVVQPSDHIDRIDIAIRNAALLGYLDTTMSNLSVEEIKILEESGYTVTETGFGTCPMKISLI